MVISDESRARYAQLRQGTPFGRNGFNLEGLRVGMGSRRIPSDPAVRCVRTEAAGVPAEWVLAPGADPDVRLLYLHGGGFVSGSGGFYLPLAAHISAAGQCAVLLPEYRLAPEDPFPAGLEDCLQAYEWLRGHGPEGPAPARAVFLGGDSAGGNLTLAMLLALRDRARPLPQGAIPLSPFADCTLSGDSLHSEDRLDPIMDPHCLPDFVRCYVTEEHVRHPLVSPAFGDYRGLPPLLIQVGEREVIRDDSVAVAARAEAAGIEVTLEIWEGMWHVFQSHEPLMPEGREAVQHIGQFIRRHGARGTTS